MPGQAILMSTHNIYFHDKIKKKKKSLRISLNICFLELSKNFKQEFKSHLQ